MFKIYLFNEVTSTMDLIKSYPINSVIIAKKQTSGRGKQNRIWVSDESENLYMSLSISLNNNRNNYANFVFITTLTMVKTLENLIQKKELDIKIKWPNDILVNNRKISGTLLESDIQKNILIIGIGLNIDKHPESTENMLFRATDLAEEGFLVKKNDVVNEFLRIFELQMNNFNISGFDDIKREWLRYAYNLGRTITIKINSAEVTGIFEGIDPTGALILNNIDNNDQKFYINSGDVF